MLAMREILSLACLCWQLVSGLGRDTQDTEYFPLSGGIDNGVQVSIKVEQIATAAEIVFWTNDRTAAFKLQVDAANKKVTRSSDLGNAPVVDFGGWPVALDTAATFVFTKRKTEWAVSIGSERFPWFDFKHQSDKALTHVSVSNVEQLNPEVTLERPTCQTACHPDECRGNDGADKCSEGTCYVTKRGTDGALSCSSATETTPDEDQHCCDGLPTPVALTAADINTTYVVLAPNPLLTRACEAFGTTCTTATAHHSTKALILSVDEAALTCTAFVPRAQDTAGNVDLPIAPSSATFTFPFFALGASRGIKQMIVDLGTTNPFDPAVDPAGFSDADAFNTVILQGTDDRFPKGYFINMVKFQVLFVGEEDRWVEWSQGVRSKFQNSALAAGNRSVWLSDEPILPSAHNPPLQCSSLSFNDTNGNSCDDYEVGGWCTDHAVPTEAGIAYWNSKNEPNCQAGGPCRMPAGYTTGDNPIRIASRNAAGFQCCVCGGGSHGEPTVPSAIFYQ